MLEAIYGKKRQGCSSIYKGVSYDRRNRKWKAQFVYKKEHFNIGMYDTEEKAWTAFKDAVQKHCVTSPN